MASSNSIASLLSSSSQKAVPTLHVLLVLAVLALVTGLLASCSSDDKRQSPGLPPEPPSPGDPGNTFAGKAVSYGEDIQGNYAPPYELENHYLSRGTFLRTPSGTPPFFFTMADASPVVVDGGIVSLTTHAIAPGGLIYNKGYVYTKTGWMPFPVVPDVAGGENPDDFIKKVLDADGNSIPTNWVRLKARAGLSYSSDDLYATLFDGENFILNYICLKPNPIEPWKCGCKVPQEGVSPSTDCGYWMLQTFDICPLGEEWNDNSGVCGPPGVAVGTTAVCGDGIISDSESCDDGNTFSSDGCDANCAIENGWSCSNEPSACEELIETPVTGPICGDGLVNQPSEYCDDGNAVESDSCTAACTPSLVCAGVPGATIASLDAQVIVDTSGSMDDPFSDPRIDQTVRALRGTDAYPNIGFVDKIFALPNGAANEIGLTEFSGDASLIRGLSAVVADLESDVNGLPSWISASTGTNYEAGLVQGLVDLCSNEGADCAVDPSDSDIAVFMTDGEPLKCTTCGSGVTDTNLNRDSGNLYYCGDSPSAYRTLDEIQRNCPAFTKSLIKQALELSQEYKTKGARLFVIGFDVKQLSDVCTDNMKLEANAVDSTMLTDQQAIALAECPEILLKKMALFGGGEYYTAKTTADETACASEPDSAACICSRDPENVACIYGELNKAYEDIASVASCMNFCGDATPSGSEQCDDGNQNDNDACKNDCRENICGDGVIETGVEECDGSVGCTAQCTLDQVISNPRDEAAQAMSTVLEPYSDSSYSGSFDVPSFVTTLLSDPVLIAGVLRGNDALVSSVEASLVQSGRNADAGVIAYNMVTNADFMSALRSIPIGNIQVLLSDVFVGAYKVDTPQYILDEDDLAAFASELSSNEAYVTAILQATPDTISSAVDVVKRILIDIGVNTNANDVAFAISSDSALISALSSYFDSLNGCLSNNDCDTGFKCNDNAQCEEIVLTSACTVEPLTYSGSEKSICIPLGADTSNPSMTFSSCSDRTHVAFPTCTIDGLCSVEGNTFDCTSLGSSFVCMDGACGLPDLSNFEARLTFTDQVSGNPLSGVSFEVKTIDTGVSVFSGGSDEKGQLLISIAQGTYNIVIQKIGFATFSIFGQEASYGTETPSLKEESIALFPSCSIATNDCSSGFSCTTSMCGCLIWDDPTAQTSCKLEMECLSGKGVCTPQGDPLAPTCFDSIQNQDETGIDCGGSTCPACPEVSAPVCGNSALEAPEECDDGNVIDGDGCSSICQAEICGNNRIDSGETCDDGNTQPFDNCDATCTTELVKNGGFESGINTNPTYSNYPNLDIILRAAYSNPSQWVTIYSGATVTSDKYVSGRQSLFINKPDIYMQKVVQAVPLSGGSYTVRFATFLSEVTLVKFQFVPFSGASTDVLSQLSYDPTGSVWVERTESITMPGDGYLYIIFLPGGYPSTSYFDDVSVYPAS